MARLHILAVAALAGLVMLLGLDAAAQTAPSQLAPATPLTLAAPSSPAGLTGAVRSTDAQRAGELLVPLNKSRVIEVDRTFKEVSIGNSEIADVVPLTQRTLYLFGRSLGSTSLTITDARGSVIAVVDIVVSYDIDNLKSQLFELVPGETIEVRPASDGVVLSGQVSNAARMQRALSLAERYAPGRVTNLMQVTGNQQVMLAVRFAEVARSVIKQLGANTNLLFENGDISVLGSFGNGLSADPLSFGAAGAALTIGDLTLNTVLDALEEQGVVKTLAEPNLIALSGDTASFLAGGEFPIPVAQNSDDSGIDVAIEFKEFGVSLAFTPTVLSDDLINLELFTEVSAIDPSTSVVFDNLTIPGLTTRRARTTVELGDGQSFAIAGLLRDDFSNAIRKFPFLGDIPLLGNLFKSKNYQLNQTELVVVVTPYMVQPAAVTSLRTPADFFIAPTDAEFFLQDQIFGTPSQPADELGRQGAAGVVGPYGYILR
jgi:pilus assembly protein CpaC